MSHPLARQTGALEQDSWIWSYISHPPTPSGEDILAGEVEQFELLIRTHNVRAYRAACAIVHDARRAEDQGDRIKSWINSIT